MTEIPVQVDCPLHNRPGPNYPPPMRVFLPSMDYKCDHCGSEGNLLAAMEVAWQVCRIKRAEANATDQALARAVGADKAPERFAPDRSV